MFDKLRRKSHRHLAKKELGQSLEHFMSAASHAAKGTGATVGPRVNAARERVQPAAGKVKDAASSGWGSTIAVLAGTATQGTREVSKATRKAKQRNAKALAKRANQTMNKRQNGRKGSKLTSLLVAGAAVGAAGALILRRRKQGWDEYEPQPAPDTAKPMDADEMLPASLAPESAKGAQTLTDTTPRGKDSDKDQTSMTKPSPTVARMAGGNSSK